MTDQDRATVPDSLVLGIDVSHYQTPDKIRWDVLAQTHSFAIVRATYGESVDQRCAEHVRRARDAGLAVGLYHFWRASVDAVSQWGAFAEVASAIRLGPGDLFPALDIEADTSPSRQPVERSWSEPLRTMADALAGRWSGCLLYGNAADFAALGNPEWIRQHRLWCAHWTQAGEPRCPPGMTWDLWQYRVGVMSSIYPGKLDQNRARLPLPVIEDHERFVHNVEQQIAVAARRTLEGLPRP